MIFHFKIIYQNIKDISVSNTCLLYCKVLQDIQLLAVSSQNGLIYIFNLNTQQLIQTIQTHGKQPIRSFDYENRLLIVASYDRSIYLYKYQNYHFTLQNQVSDIHDKEIKSIAYYNDMIFTVSRDRSLRVTQEFEGQYEILQIIQNAANSDIKYIKIIQQQEDLDTLFILISTADGFINIFKMEDDEINLFNSIELPNKIIYQADYQNDKITAITHDGIFILNNNPLKISQNAIYNYKYIDQKYFLSCEDGNILVVNENGEFLCKIENISEAPLNCLDIYDNMIYSIGDDGILHIGQYKF